MTRFAADRAYLELVAALADEVSELAHVDASRILFVAGAARRESKASIRPLAASGGWEKPRIVIDGIPMLYEICLRPRFFRASSPEARLEILVHELWHASPAFDGTLAQDRRHASNAPVEAEVQAILQSWERRPELETVLAHRGELTLRAWLSRPPTRFARGTRTRALYTETDLFDSIVEQL